MYVYVYIIYEKLRSERVYSFNIRIRFPREEINLKRSVCCANLHYT